MARIYIMQAVEGRDASLEQALLDAMDAIRPVPGCEGIELLRDAGHERRFLFIEKWASIEAHKAAASHLPKGLFDPIMACLDGPPDGSYLDYLKTV